MRKYFNVEGACYPEEHYMVDLTERLIKIKELVDRRKYFIINKGRQYGKTTTLEGLAQFLREAYIVIHLDFQFLTYGDFTSEPAFVAAFAESILQALQGVSGVDPCLAGQIAGCAEGGCGLSKFFRCLSGFCEAAGKPVVLIIDEADSVADNQIFLDLLALLRGYYQQRRRYATFQSVILAGVYDSKRIKEKIRPQGEHKVNSPWNIAADFDIEMELTVSGIRGMLEAYEEDCRTGMDVGEMAERLYAYTSGYPVLVSRLCKLMDETLPGRNGFPNPASAWTREGFLAAEKLLLEENSPLFASLTNKLADYPKLREMLYSMLLQGKKFRYNADNEVVDIASMFGFVKNAGGDVAVSNRIFETRLYNLFLSEEEMGSRLPAAGAEEESGFVEKFEAVYHKTIL